MVVAPRGGGTGARGVLARALPIRVEPLDDEAFDGYLEHVAHRLCTDPRDLLSQLRLPERDETPYRLVRSFDTADTKMICRTFNLEPDELLRMTLARWSHLGLTPPRTERRGNFSGAWPRGAGARYCPLCLHERDYRVRLTDRLQHVYVCGVHQVWLETLCPVCQRPPRSRARFYSRTPPARAGTLSCPVGCASSVLSQVTPEPVMSGPYVEDHAFVLRLLEGQRIDVWDGRLPADVALLDLAYLARLALAAHGRQQVTTDLRSTGLTTSDDVRLALQGLPDGDGSPRLARAVEDVRVGAHALSVALHVLRARDEMQATERLAWATGAGTWRPSRAASPVSFQLTRVLQESIPARSTPRRVFLGLLRSTSEVSGGTQRVLDASMLPATLWPQALSALPESLRVHPWYGDALLSVFLLGTGRKRRWSEIATELDLSLIAQLSTNYVLTHFKQITRQPASAELLSLFRLLADHRPPIDYARRRALFSKRLDIGRNHLKRIARANDEPVTDMLQARCTWYLHECLTGGDATLGTLARDAYGPRRRLFARWKLNLRKEAQQGFALLAEGHLKRNRLPEPVTWSPIHQAGEWVAPEPDLHRNLSGWSKVPLRASSRSTLPDTPTPEAVAVQAASGSEALLRVRLERFLLLLPAGYNVTRAATLGGFDQATFSAQLQRLERQLGGALLERAERQRPGRLTDLGHQLEKALKDQGLRPALPRRAMLRT